MKIKVSLTVDVDPETWELVYGRTDTRNDVREYVMHLVHETLYENVGGSADLS